MGWMETGFDSRQPDQEPRTMTLESSQEDNRIAEFHRSLHEAYPNVDTSDIDEGFFVAGRTPESVSAKIRTMCDRVASELGQERFRALRMILMYKIAGDPPGAHVGQDRGRECIFVNMWHPEQEIVDDILAIAPEFTAKAESASAALEARNTAEALAMDWIEEQKRSVNITFEIGDIKDPDVFSSNKDKISSVFAELTRMPGGSMLMGLRVILTDAGGTRRESDADGGNRRDVVDMTDDTKTIKDFFVTQYLS